MSHTGREDNSTEMLQTLKSDISKHKNVIVYGAGQNAHAPLLWLRDQYKNEIEIHVAVTRKKGNEIFHGYEVKQIDELTGLSKCSVVLVSVFSGFFDDIKNTLEQLGFANVYYVDTWFYLSAYYNEFWDLPIRRKGILVENFHGRGYGDSPRYIVDELLKSESDLDIAWIISGDKETSVPDGVRTVEMYSREFFYETATAGVWISNVRKYQPVLKREGQFYLQTWHGFTLKRIEKDAKEVSNGISKPYFDAGEKDSKMIDCLLSNSSFLTKIFRQTFWYDGWISETGTPRNDILFRDHSKEANEIKEKYKIPSESHVLLYAPTFRSSYADDPIDADIVEVLGALEEKFKTPFSAMIRMHPNIEGKASLFEYSDRIVNVTAHPDFMELLTACDVLLTDYSSCMFDYMFSKKPVFLYAKDLERYVGKDRGFYLDYRSLPFPISCNNQMLIENIREFDSESYLKALADFEEGMGFVENGDASKRAAQIILNEVNKT